MFEIWFKVPLSKGGFDPSISSAIGGSRAPLLPDHGRQVEELSALFHGFAVVLTPFNLLLMMIGIVLGVIIGVLPGLGGANGVAILLPLTFTMPPTSAIIMLSCIYWGALFGGAITSILFNIPGEPWSVATTFDGYPMAQQGRAGEALTAAFTSSFVGAFVAVVMITFFLRRWSRSSHCSSARPSFLGLSADVLQLHRHGQGLAVQDAGGDDARLRARRGGHGHRHRPIAADFRFTDLMRGFDFLIAVIGLFGIGEILLSMEEGFPSPARPQRSIPRWCSRRGGSCRDALADLRSGAA